MGFVQELARNRRIYRILLEEDARTATVAPPAGQAEAPALKGMDTTPEYDIDRLPVDLEKLPPAVRQEEMPGESVRFAAGQSHAQAGPWGGVVPALSGERPGLEAPVPGRQDGLPVFSLGRVPRGIAGAVPPSGEGSAPEAAPGPRTQADVTQRANGAEELLDALLDREERERRMWPQPVE